MAFYIILLLLWARVCYFICMCYFCSYEMVIMKNLFRTVSVIALAGWFLACSERKSEAYYEIIPAPLEIRENSVVCHLEFLIRAGRAWGVRVGTRVFERD